MATADESPRFTARLSDTTIADEYRTIVAGLRPCEPAVQTFDPVRHPPAVLERACNWWTAMTARVRGVIRRST